MASKTLDVRVLEQAMERIGGKRALAAHLMITEKDLQAFLEGTARPTRVVFLGAVDVLLEFGDWSGLDELSSVTDLPELSPAPERPSKGKQGERKL